MLHHYLIGVGAFALLSAGWVAVQRAWRKSFPEIGADPDVLAGRPDCKGCSRRDVCHSPDQGQNSQTEEDLP